VKEWPKVPLGELAQINPDNYSTFERWPTAPYLDSSAIVDNKILRLKEIDIPSFNKKKKRLRKVKKGDIIYSALNPYNKHYGLVAQVPEHLLLSLILFVIRPSEHIDGKYLYYYLTSDFSLDYFERVAKQSRALIPGFTPDDLERYPIPLPPMETQKRIGSFLEKVWTLIDLNKQKIDILEQLQKTIYQEMASKAKRWKTMPLTAIADVHNGTNLTGKTFTETGYRVYGCGKKIRYYPEYLFEKPRIYLMAHGVNSGIVGVSRPYSWILNSVVVIHEKKPEYFEFLKEWAITFPFNETFSGKLMSHITKTDVKTIELPVPPEKTLLELHERLAPMNEAEEALREKNDKLAEIKREFSPLLYENRIRLAL
jgi:restriction endonuclease S subunit